MEKIKDGFLLIGSKRENRWGHYYPAIIKKTDGRLALVIGRIDGRYKNAQLAPVDMREYIIDDQREFLQNVIQVLTNPEVWEGV